MEDATRNERLRALPSVDELLARPSLKWLLSPHPRPMAVAAIRKAVGEARSRLLRGDERGFSEEDVAHALQQLRTPGLRRVLNATGVVLHTNLGRAPLAASAVARVSEIASGYCNLEYDLEEGARGSRHGPVSGLLRELTGAEDALVVNNNAAAVLLVLSTLAAGREAIVSRGELVEIGGGFRIPDVMGQSGATLVEVGTTNRTRLEDYEQALGPRTGLLVKVHPSNFAQVGFTQSVPTARLVELGERHQVPVFEDLGSGMLVQPLGEGIPSETTVRQVVSSGAQVVTFSGDKLLGGPQSGIIVGRGEFLARIRKHPLMRAMRVDKMTVAALEATLELYRDGRLDELPAHRLLVQRAEALEARAHRLAICLKQQGVMVEVREAVGQVGGGAMPLAEPRSFACIVAVRDAERVQQTLRSGTPPVVARVTEGQILLDVRCLDEGDLGPVATAMGIAIGDAG